MENWSLLDISGYNFIKPGTNYHGGNQPATNLTAIVPNLAIVKNW